MSKRIEEWKSVVNYEGLYEVSDWGNVRSVDRTYKGRNQYGAVFVAHKHGKLLKPCYDKDGYCIVSLSKEGEHSNKKIHRLVAEAWIPNPLNKPIVGHTKPLADGTEDKTSNEVWNIQWMTVEENNIYGTLRERQRDSHSGEKCYNFGKHPSEETRKKMSESQKLFSISRKRNNKGRFEKDED
jgi:hypothetical protein